jgi:molybdate transport system substrate-binding protein
MRALAFVIALSAAAGTVEAAEIDAFISTAIKSATDQSLPPFERANGHVIRAVYGPSGALIPRFERGEPVDVFLTDATALDALLKQGKVIGPRIDLAKTGIGIAVKKGTAKPDVSTPEALKRALLAAKSVGYASPAGGSITGGHILRMFEKLGIADQIKPKTRLAMGGPDSRVSVLVSSGEAEIGLQQASELLANPDVEVIGMLPPELQQTTIYCAGITANAKHADAATALIAALTSPAAQTIFKAKGLGL